MLLHMCNASKLRESHLHASTYIYIFHKYMLFITAYWTTATTTCNDHISDETNTMFGVVLISGVVDMCMSNKNFWLISTAVNVLRKQTNIFVAATIKIREPRKTAQKLNKMYISRTHIFVQFSSASPKLLGAIRIFIYT